MRILCLLLVFLQVFPASTAGAADDPVNCTLHLLNEEEQLAYIDQNFKALHADKPAFRRLVIRLYRERITDRVFRSCLKSGGCDADAIRKVLQSEIDRFANGSRRIRGFLTLSSFSIVGYVISKSAAKYLGGDAFTAVLIGQLFTIVIAHVVAPMKEMIDPLIRRKVFSVTEEVNGLARRSPDFSDQYLRSQSIYTATEATGKNTYLYVSESVRRHLLAYMNLVSTGRVTKAKQRGKIAGAFLLEMGRFQRQVHFADENLLQLIRPYLEPVAEEMREVRAEALAYVHANDRDYATPEVRKYYESMFDE